MISIPKLADEESCMYMEVFSDTGMYICTLWSHKCYYRYCIHM